METMKPEPSHLACELPWVSAASIAGQVTGGSQGGGAPLTLQRPLAFSRPPPAPENVEACPDWLAHHYCTASFQADRRLHSVSRRSFGHGHGCWNLADTHTAGGGEERNQTPGEADLTDRLVGSSLVLSAPQITNERR